MSAATLWEISIKVQLGKLELPERFGPAALIERGYTLLSITPAHALALGTKDSSFWGYNRTGPDI